MKVYNFEKDLATVEPLILELSDDKTKNDPILMELYFVFAKYRKGTPPTKKIELAVFNLFLAMSKSTVLAIGGFFTPQQITQILGETLNAAKKIINSDAIKPDKSR